MKKIILTLIFSFLLIPKIVLAANASIQISAPSSVYVGDSVKVSVTLSSSSSLGSWQYNVAYDDGRLTYVSTTAEAAQRVVNYASGSGKTSVTYTWNFKANSEGSATFSVNGIDVYSFDDDSQMTVSGSKSKTISIIKPTNNTTNNTSGNKPKNNYTYSGNNNLSSLTVEGYDLDFNSDKVDYSISVPNDVRSIKIGATAADKNASVSGIGDHELIEGKNEISIIVTAENGNKKTYNLSVDVMELEPIMVNIDNAEYSLIRKSDLLGTMVGSYSLSTVLINGEEIPCYYSEITGFYLVGLKDSEGNINIYRYDNSNNEFKIYNQIELSGIYIAILEPTSIPNGYELGSITINDSEIKAYIKEGSLPLIYGVNIETGESNFYSYDSSEGTIQKYVINEKTDKRGYYPYIIIGLSGLCLLEFIMIICVISSKNKKLKKVLRNKLETKTEYESSFEPKKNTVYKDEKNITDDLTDEYMSSSEELGHTALISNSVNNVFDNSVNRKDLKKKAKKKKQDDDMYKF